MAPMTLLKNSLKNSKTLEKEQKVTYQRKLMPMIICDDEFLTADTELPSDSDILAEFRRDENELEEEDEVLIDEPPPKRPSKHELCHTMGVLQTFSLFIEVETDSFKTNLRKLSRMIDSNRFVEKRQGTLTDYFMKK